MICAIREILFIFSHTTERLGNGALVAAIAVSLSPMDNVNSLILRLAEEILFWVTLISLASFFGKARAN